jgi:hypothetical protein
LPATSFFLRWALRPGATSGCANWIEKRRGLR